MSESQKALCRLQKCLPPHAIHEGVYADMDEMAVAAEIGNKSVV